MPLQKPQMTNNLGGSFFNQPSSGGFNPQSAGSLAIPQIGSSIASGVGTALQGAFSAPPPGSALGGGFNATPQSAFNFGTTSAPAPFTGIGTTPTPNNITPLASGGITFNPTAAKGFSTASLPKATPGTETASGRPSLSSFINNTVTGPSGTSLTVSGNGSVQNSTSGNQFSIDHTGPVPSNALSSNTGMGDIAQTHSQYQDYVNALAQAEGYSPAYQEAYKQQQLAQLNQLALQSNLYTGNNLPGDTMNYAQGATAKAEAQNALQAGVAGINLQTQALQRTGNIAGAQALVQAAQPVGVSPGTSLVSPLSGQPAYSGLGGLTGVDAVGQWNNLSQQYPGVVQPYDPTLSPAQNAQMAQQAVQQSPQFQSQYLNSYTTPGGGTGLYNKLNTGGLSTNNDGTISLVSGAAASLGSAESASLNQNLTTYNQLAPAFKAANADFTAMNQFMQQAGINQSGIPVVNQIQDKINANVLNPGAIGAFKSYIASLRTNYANLLGARGETPTQAGNSADELIPDNLNVSQMQQIQQALNANGGNILNATGQQISQIMEGLQGGGTGVQQQPQTSNIGSSWNF